MKIKLTHKSNFFKRVDSIFEKCSYLSQKTSFMLTYYKLKLFFNEVINMLFNLKVLIFNIPVDKYS